MLVRGVIRAFDPVTWTATVELIGGLATLVENMPVAGHLGESDLLDGTKCGVILFDPNNPADGCVVWTYKAGLAMGHAGTKEWLPADTFDIAFGSPTLTPITSSPANQHINVWAFDKNVTQSVSTSYLAPATGNIKMLLYWCMPTVIVGAVQWMMRAAATSKGEYFPQDPGGGTGSPCTVPGTARDLEITEMPSSVPVVAGDVAVVEPLRWGGFGGDTADEVAYLVGVLVEYL